MTFPWAGATVNAGGTLLSTAKPAGSIPVDLTDPKCDSTTLVKSGGRMVTIQYCINKGHLRRHGTTLTEMNTPQPYTRSGS